MEAEEFLEVCSNREGSCLISIDQLAEVQLLGYMAAGGSQRAVQGVEIYVV